MCSAQADAAHEHMCVCRAASVDVHGFAPPCARRAWHPAHPLCHLTPKVGALLGTRAVRVKECKQHDQDARHALNLFHLFVAQMR